MTPENYVENVVPVAASVTSLPQLNLTPEPSLLRRYESDVKSQKWPQLNGRLG